MIVALIADFELFHPCDQGVGANAKQFGRSAGTADFAVRRSKRSINVRGHDVVDWPYVRVDP